MLSSNYDAVDVVKHLQLSQFFTLATKGVAMKMMVNILAASAALLAASPALCQSNSSPTITVSQGESTVSDRDIITLARKATDTGDFSELEKLAANFLADAKKRWEPHEAQDRRCEEYSALSGWKKIFRAKPFCGAMYGRVSAAEDVMFADSLIVAVARRDVRHFTDRR